jgi:predicted RNA-binding Zn-ribbon protein involved in translation (DUF1610 family)
MNDGFPAGGVLLLLTGAYLLPTVISAVRFRSNTLAIFALNLFAGWTLVGWVVALVWSLSAADKATVVVDRQAGGSTVPLTRRNSKQCPMCAELILKAAKKCRHCGHLLETAKA